MPELYESWAATRLVSMHILVTGGVGFIGSHLTDAFLNRYDGRLLTHDAQVNVVGTVNVLEAARRADARTLFCSTGGALYDRLHGTRQAVLRLANVYGPRQDPAGEAGVVTIFCSRVMAGKRPTIYGDGEQTRDYVYVGDIVSAFLAAADTGRPGIWNIGTGVTAVELASGILAGALLPRSPTACERSTGGSSPVCHAAQSHDACGTGGLCVVT